MKNLKLTHFFIGLLIYCSASIAYGQNFNATFTHGIASGDPDQSSVLLWTRLVPEDSNDVVVRWDMATDPEFVYMVAKGEGEAKKENDFCVKVIAYDLLPGNTYYYRFYYGELYSPVGRTNTLPKETDHVRIGVTNCSKYTGGYYHAFDALSKIEGMDAIIHLGDYIYENGPAKPGDSYWPAFQATARQHEPPYECMSLEDYRMRYSQYRADTALLKLHARYPFIAIWDDHEIAMKDLKKLPDGSLQYNGDWEGRLNNSLKAYFEWIPIRVEMGEDIYRSFQFGKMVNLMMLDTRVCCKSEVPKTKESLRDTSRHIVGNKQLNWIFKEVLDNEASWNVMGNQLLVALKGNGWERWQGFPADRNRLLDFMKDHPKLNFLITTGNAHNPHHYIVMDENHTDTLVHEVLPGSISSGNNSEKARYEQKIIDKEAKRLDNEPNVLWYHQDSHGFIVMDLKEKRTQVEWYFVSSIRKPEYKVWRPYTAVVKAKK